LEESLLKIIKEENKQYLNSPCPANFLNKIKKLYTNFSLVSFLHRAIFLQTYIIFAKPHLKRSMTYDYLEKNVEMITGKNDLTDNLSQKLTKQFKELKEKLQTQTIELENYSNKYKEFIEENYPKENDSTKIKDLKKDIEILMSKFTHEKLILESKK